MKCAKPLSWASKQKTPTCRTSRSRPFGSFLRKSRVFGRRRMGLSGRLRSPSRAIVKEAGDFRHLAVLREGARLHHAEWVVSDRVVIDKLNAHIRGELDILAVVDEALSVCTLDDIRAKLRDFRQEHERHIERLSEIVASLGGEPTSRRDLVGVLMGVSARIGARSDASGLRVLRRDLERTASRYESSLFDELRPNVREAYEQILADERRHMSWLDETIKERGWEEVPPPWPVP